MPNWVRNKIMVGRPDIIERLKAKYCSRDEETRELEFDFNKVIPMPKELMVEFSSKSDHALSLYLTRICPTADYYGSKADKVTKKEWDAINRKIQMHMIAKHSLLIEKEKLNQALDRYKGEEDSLLALGKRQVDNIMKHDALNWYEWSVRNWGTKWNSCNLSVDTSGKAISFDTAWDPAIPVFLEISRQNPDIKFAMLFSDECIGSHVGYLLAHQGEIDYEGSFPDQSLDAYRLAMDVWDCKDEYEIDEREGTCVRIDEKRPSKQVEMC